MKSLGLALAVLTISAASAGAADCARLCARKRDPGCMDKCEAVAAQAEKKKEQATLRTGHLGGVDELIPEEQLKGMSEDDLEKWRREYRRRKTEFMDRCNLAQPSDPNYGAIQGKCAASQSSMDTKLQQLDEESRRRKAELAAAEACKDPARLSDEQYCKVCRLPCRMDSTGRLVPLEKSDRAIAKERKAGEKRREAAEKKSRAKESAAASVDCSGLLSKHQASCAGLDERGPHRRSVCMAAAKRAADAECAALRNLKANEGNR